MNNVKKLFLFSKQEIQDCLLYIDSEQFVYNCTQQSNQSALVDSVTSKFITSPILFASSDSFFDEFLLTKKACIENEIGLELIPTYSFLRKYIAGSILPSHKDKDACEVTVTINLKSEGPPNTLFIENNNNIEEILLQPGEAAIYAGCQWSHWREMFTENQSCVQLMLHYIVKNGSKKLN